MRNQRQNLKQLWTSVGRYRWVELSKLVKVLRNAQIKGRCGRDQQLDHGMNLKDIVHVANHMGRWGHTCCEIVGSPHGHHLPSIPGAIETNQSFIELAIGNDNLPLTKLPTLEKWCKKNTTHHFGS